MATTVVHLLRGALAAFFLLSAAAPAAAAEGGKVAPGPARVSLARALEMTGAKEYRGARAMFQSVFAAEPDNPVAGPMARLIERTVAGEVSADALQLVVEGLQRDQEGKPAEAAAKISQAAALAPSDAVVHYLLGVVYERGKDDEKALAAYRAAIQLDPQFERAYVASADVMNRRGQCDQAIAACDRALGVNARYAQAFVSRGRAYEAKGDLDKATADFEAALRLRPTAEVYRLLAAVQEKAGRAKEAEAARAAAARLEKGLGGGK